MNSQELKWSSKRLNADDAHVVAYVVAFSTVLQKLVLGANSIGDAGASSIAEAHTNSLPLSQLWASQPLHPLALTSCSLGAAYRAFPAGLPRIF